MNKNVKHFGGTVPHLGVKADHSPERSETGIGALMPWAGRLWFVTYVSHKSGTGAGTGLFCVDDNLEISKHEASCVGTYANRLIHHESDQLIIGPHAIDPEGNVRTFSDLTDVRLTATARHLKDCENKVYFLGMEGEFIEADVNSMEVTFLSDLTEELSVNDKPHFKDAYTGHGRVVVANNSYYHKDFERGHSDGRLAEWDGDEWQVLARTQFNTVTGRLGGDLGRAIYAAGQDRASALLHVWMSDTGWKVYRLPKSTYTQDHAVTTEWPRIREIESERWLMDISGMFYEMPSMTYGNALRGIVPICRHLRIIPDYCSWNGLLVLGGDQTTPLHDSNPFVGQPQANLRFMNTDDLWKSGGKVAGQGGPWWQTEVLAGQPSDPFLMFGFDRKCLHLSHCEKGSKKFRIEVDFRGDGTWCQYDEVSTSDEYCYHVFPEGFDCQWVRLVPKSRCTATAQFVYS